MIYNNYHKHTHRSNIYTPDTHIKINDYIKRMKELNHKIYFTTEHGYGGSIFEAKQLCEKENIKCVYAAEVYCVLDGSLKDNSNYHLVLIAKTDNGRKQINKILSFANKNYYYYKPRVDLNLLNQLNPYDVYITTACIAGIISDNQSINNIFLPLLEKFKDNIFLEVQAHKQEIQINHNKKVLELSQKYNVKIIHANDSHYIYPEQSKDRLIFLEGKKILYDNEDSFILDFPNYQTILERYEKQGVLSPKQTIESLENTLIFDDCEEININNNVKMPTIYPNLNIDQKHDKLKDILVEKFEKIKITDNIKDIEKYKKAIDFEFNIIKETSEVNTVDYFLLNERIINKAVNEYGGVLTKTGRGSNVAFYINRLLGFTEIDRMTSDIPLYPTRFMSKSRILETRSMPDCDYNTKHPEPFIKATKDIIGEDNCYWMIAYGTMQESEAFRNVCRSIKIEHDEYNKIAKNLEKYKNDKKWREIIKESEKYIGVIVSSSPHPCANLILDKSISEELGILKVGDQFCAIIDSDEADEWKYLKNDYLTVSVWEIIDETFKLIGIPCLSIIKLKEALNEKVWNLYAKGLTSTINQVDGDWTTQLSMKYKPQTIEELAKFTSCIRPFFNPWRDSFINREEYTTGVKQLDQLYESTNHYILFQENLMQFLTWLGVEDDKTIGIIKKISKKKISQDDFSKFEKGLRENWIKQVGDDLKFDETWQMIQSCLEYGYNSPHALAVTYDSLYCAYLKVNYPLEYFSVVLNLYQGSTDKTNNIVQELQVFGIKLKKIQFRYSRDKYFFDKDSKTIYKGINSIKFCNESIAEELYNLRNNQYNDFVNVLYDLEKTSINSKQLIILIKLDFFKEFGISKTLEIINENFKLFKNGNAKQMEVTKIENDILKNIIKRHSRLSPSGKTFMELDCKVILIEFEEFIKMTETKDYSIKEKMEFQKEYLGYIDLTTEREEDRQKLMVLEVNSLISKFGDEKPWCYVIDEISIGSGKKNRLNINPKLFKSKLIKAGDIILAKKVKKNEKGYWYLLDYDILDIE